VAVSKAQQKAVHKYTKANYDRFLVTMKPKGCLDEIKAHAAACGQSVNAFINAAIAEKMGGPPTSPAEAPTAPPTGADGILTCSTVKAAQEAAQAAGEAVPQFIERAVEEQAKRDEMGRKMKGGG